MYRGSLSTADGRIDTCPECGGRIVARSELVCRDCGLVLGSLPPDFRPRRRRSRARDGGRATGAPLSPTRPNRCLSSYVGRRRDARGNRVSSRTQRRLHRQRTQQRRAARAANKQTLQPGLSEIARVCAVLEVSDSVRANASVLFRRALAEHLLYGRAYESIAGATVYLGSRQAQVVRTLTEVTNASRCPNNSVVRDVRFLQRELEIAVDSLSATAYLPRLGSTLGLDERIVRRARQLLEAAIEENLHSGRDPKGVAAGALYTVSLLEECRVDLRQTEVAAAADVSPETVRARFSEFESLCPDAIPGASTEMERPASRAGTRRNGSRHATGDD
ncbi:transcription initiation factor IIB family protein [Halobacteria archaeon HArc-curdl5-1]|uniref:Transcription initiation factor IIB family protein n=2 Tax=Halapricum hydrolyticum TaxID=2979991 RepID=A0AAE3LEQ1_9EURY|nr:transcription initiation factor IIB family protein [Halapricum hydrolyticum]MCU4726706.1 transcription initiation factor IIB family protein [Halapricum hydrolyticum]